MRTREEIESIQKVISCKRGRYPDLSSAQTIELVLEVLLERLRGRVVITFLQIKGSHY